MSTSLRSIYKEIKSSDSSEIVTRHSFNGISEAEISAAKEKGYEYYEGKVRQCISKEDKLFVIHTDRLSAFDRMIGMVPYKGAILNKISDFWLTKAKEILPTHLIKQVDDRSLETLKAEPVKAEVIVRGYLAGSMMRAYADGERDFCGNTLPDGLTPYGKLPERIITPTTKAAAFEHDENSSANELIEKGIVTKEEWAQIEKMSLDLFELGTKVYKEKGWILVDTKYEFGRLPNGEIIIIDEIHTPDSSRFWVNESYETLVKSNQPPIMLDKEIIRRYLMSVGFKGHGDVPHVPNKQLIELAEVYLDVAEALIGSEMTVNTEKYSASFL